MNNAEEIKRRQERQWNANATNWERQQERRERDWLPVSEWLCRATSLSPAMDVLDLACGSGQPALMAAGLVGPHGKVVASDLAEEMVELTLSRARGLGVANVEGCVADAEALEFGDASFDAVTMQFGLMFCPEPHLVAAEVHRVLKPDCSFALSVWADRAKSPGQTVMAQALALAGMPAPASGWEAGPAGRLAAPGVMEDVLRLGGFETIQIGFVPMTYTYDSPDEYWAEQLASPLMKTLVENSGAKELEHLKWALLEVLKPYLVNGLVRLPVTALCAGAQK